MPEKTVTIDPSTCSVSEVYKIIASTIIPRPIAFVSTVNLKGCGNLSPFSSFNLVGSKPATLLFSIVRRPDGSKKDTLRNIEETRQFVVNASSKWFAEKLVQTASLYPPEIDEMKAVGFTSVPSIKVKPPRVGEAAVSFECETLQLVETGDGAAGACTIVIGKIVLVHMREEIANDLKNAWKYLKPVARLGGLTYAEIGDVFDMAIPEL